MLAVCTTVFDDRSLTLNAVGEFPTFSDLRLVGATGLGGRGGHLKFMVFAWRFDMVHSS